MVELGLYIVSEWSLQRIQDKNFVFMNHNSRDPLIMLMCWTLFDENTFSKKYFDKARKYSPLSPDIRLEADVALHVVVAAPEEALDVVGVAPGGHHRLVQ